MTFNAKNLHYEKQEPEFLRRLRSENTSDRHHVSVARPRKPRLDTRDDDGPTIVDEQGENVTEKEFQNLLHGRNGSDLVSGAVSTDVRPDPDLESKGSLPDPTNNTSKEPEQLHGGVKHGLKKRKQVKAVAVETDAERETDHPVSGYDSASAKADDEPKTRTRSKKKKIKLSFDGPEG